MNKTVSINLANFSFVIDENAYEVLHSYLLELKKSLEEEEQEEVMNDIEFRIVEIFKERLKGREVVTQEDVDKVIQLIGRPEQIGDSEKTVLPENQPTEIVNKKLFRDPEHRILGGVCSGLSYFTGIDMIIIRLIFGIGFFFYGILLIVYIVLWIVVPKVETKSEYLMMIGKPNAFENIKDLSYKSYRFLENKSSVFSKILSVFLRGIILLVCLLFISCVVAISYLSIPFILTSDLYNIYEVVGIISAEVIALIFFALISVKVIFINLNIKHYFKILGGLFFIEFLLCICLVIGRIKTYQNYKVEVKKIQIDTPENSLKILRKDDDVFHLYDYKPTISIERRNIEKPYLEIREAVFEKEGKKKPITIPVEIEGNEIIISTHVPNLEGDILGGDLLRYKLVIPEKMEIIRNDFDEDFDDELDRKLDKKLEKIDEKLDALDDIQEG